jgi:replicative DNA helicase
LSAASTSHRSSDLHSAKNTLNTLVRDLAQVEKTHSPTIDLKQDIGNIIENYKIPKNTKSIMTGYPEIDDLVGGFKPGWLVLVAALPKVGKTRTLVNLACGMVKRKANVLIFTLEVPRDQYVNLCMSCFSGIPYSALDKHTLNPEYLQKLSQVQYEIENNYGNLTIVDTLGGCTPNFIQAELEKRQLENERKYDVVIVDHGTMMRPDNSVDQDHLNQVQIAEGLRAIARKHHITVLAAVQRKNDESLIKKAVKQSKDDSKNTYNYEVGGESIARSYGWFQTADVLFINQNNKQDSSTGSPLRFSVISRYGSTDSFYLTKDFNITSLISVRSNSIHNYL